MATYDPQDPIPVPHHSESFFSTPAGIITAGILMWIVAVLFTAGATVAVVESHTSPPAVSGTTPAADIGPDSVPFGDAADKPIEPTMDDQADTESAATAAGREAAGLDAASTGVFVHYLMYIPSLFCGLVGTCMLIVGSVRWGMSHPGQADSNAVLEVLESINDRLMLSDTAKRIAYRQHDVNALRRTITEDIERGSFDGAMVLVQVMSQTFGYREEAETFRDQIMTARAADMEAKIDQAIVSLDQIIDSYDFDKAGREAAKLQRIFPDSERVKNLDTKVAQAREQYKYRIEREFLAAAEHDDVDSAMTLLKELDKHLTEEEAGPFRETARGVIGKSRDNLGVQFKLAVHDKDWVPAVRVGEQIIREFPNTRMADEVRTRLDRLRELAAGQQAAQYR